MEMDTETRLDLRGSARPSIEVDYARYESFLKESDLSDEQKREFINALWSIIVGFVDLGFGVHPAQQACGEPADRAQRDGASAPDEVDYTDGMLPAAFDPVSGRKAAEERDHD